MTEFGLSFRRSLDVQLLDIVSTLEKELLEHELYFTGKLQGVIDPANLKCSNDIVYMVIHIL